MFTKFQIYRTETSALRAFAAEFKWELFVALALNFAIWGILGALVCYIKG